MTLFIIWLVGAWLAGCGHSAAWLFDSPDPSVSMGVDKALTVVVTVACSLLSWLSIGYTLIRLAIRGMR